MDTARPGPYYIQVIDSTEILNDITKRLDGEIYGLP